MDVKDPTTEDIFECRMCGDCCQGFGGTYVTEDDIKAIAALRHEDPKTILAKYCEMAGSKPVLARGKDGFCIFFDREKQCTIHPVKPRMCRTWPFLKTLIKHPENWDAMASCCPGMKKGIPHSRLKDVIARKHTKHNPA